MDITITAVALTSLSFDDVARMLGADRLIDTDRTGVVPAPTSEANTVASVVRPRAIATAPAHVDGPGIVLISAENNPLI